MLSVALSISTPPLPYLVEIPPSFRIFTDTWITDETLIII